MPQQTCPLGHRWEGEGPAAGVCPVCSSADETNDRAPSSVAAPSGVADELPPPPAPAVESPTWRYPETATEAGTPDTPARAGCRYRVLRPHARGGLGEVFVAEDTELGRHVALKEIQADQADRAESRTRFVLEASLQ